MTQHAPSADTLNAWLVEQGLEGTPQETLLDGYCARLVAMGIPLMRLHVSQSAFHPKYGGLGFEWWRNREVTSERYEFSETPASMWVESPFYQILRTGLMEHRERLSQSGPPSRFPLLNGLRAEGATDYFATGLAMEPREQSLPMNPDSPPEGLLVSWVGDRQDGFRDGDLQTFRGSLPFLALVLKSAANRQVASELLRIYLGRDAGRRVLSGELQRGSTQRIDAVICYFDLTGFTALAEQVPGPDLIAMLNDYFGLMVSAIQARGGHILKFMGDGLLAMFDQDGRGDQRGLAAREVGGGCGAGHRGIAAPRPDRPQPRAPQYRPAGHGLYDGAACGRDSLWQYRRRKPAGFHRHRAGGEPDRAAVGDAPGGRAGGHPVRGGPARRDPGAARSGVAGPLHDARRRRAARVVHDLSGLSRRGALRPGPSLPAP